MRKYIFVYSKHYVINYVAYILLRFIKLVYALDVPDDTNICFVSMRNLNIPDYGRLQITGTDPIGHGCGNCISPLHIVSMLLLYHQYRMLL